MHSSANTHYEHVAHVFCDCPYIVKTQLPRNAMCNSINPASRIHARIHPIINERQLDIMALSLINCGLEFVTGCVETFAAPMCKRTHDSKFPHLVFGTRGGGECATHVLIEPNDFA